MKFVEIINEGRKKSEWNINNSKVRVIKTKRPKFGGKGRTWDSEYKTINNERVEVFLDTTWGSYAYFQKNGQWYKFQHLDVENW